MKKMEIELLLDKSGSMMTADCKGGKTRWAAGQEQAIALATHAQTIDPNGITVVPFAGKFKVYENVTPGKVSQVFTENEPNGSTDTAAVLKNRLDAFFTRKAAGATDPCCIIVLTDGAPDDQKAVGDVIIEATKKLDRDEELAIQFVQIGADPEASRFLAYLDDSLSAQGAKFDIVDTTKLNDLEDFTIAQLLEKSFND